ncbi:hypothetical protein ACOSP7_025223 [Xanthoceras sorbifolium]
MSDKVEGRDIKLLAREVRSVMENLKPVYTIHYPGKTKFQVEGDACRKYTTVRAPDFTDGVHCHQYLVETLATLCSKWLINQQTCLSFFSFHVLLLVLFFNTWQSGF